MKQGSCSSSETNKKVGHVSKQKLYIPLLLDLSLILVLLIHTDLLHLTLSYEAHLSKTAQSWKHAITQSQSSLVPHGEQRQTLSVPQLWLFVTPSLNTATRYGQNPVTQTCKYKKCTVAFAHARRATCWAFAVLSSLHCFCRCLFLWKSMGSYYFFKSHIYCTRQSLKFFFYLITLS